MLVYVRASTAILMTPHFPVAGALSATVNLVAATMLYLSQWWNKSERKEETPQPTTHPYQRRTSKKSRHPVRFLPKHTMGCCIKFGSIYSYIWGDGQTRVTVHWDQSRSLFLKMTAGLSLQLWLSTSRPRIIKTTMRRIKRGCVDVWRTRKPDVSSQWLLLKNIFHCCHLEHLPSIFIQRRNTRLLVHR